MAKCARSSSTLAIQLMLLLLIVYWCMNDKVTGRGIDVAGGSDDDDVVAMMIRCSSATIFGLLTANCASRNISFVKQLRLDRHEEVKVLRLADNRLIELGPDELYRVVPHIQQLYLAENFVAHVDESAFRNLHSLQVGAQLSKVQYTLYEVAYTYMRYE